MTNPRENPRGLLLIAAFKLLKGFSLLAVGIAVHLLEKRDLVAEAQRWADLFRIDPHNHYLNTLIAKMTNVDRNKLRELSYWHVCLFFAVSYGRNWLGAAQTVGGISDHHFHGWADSV